MAKKVSGAAQFQASAPAPSAAPEPTPLTDAAEFNAIGYPRDKTGLPVHEQDLVGATLRGKTVLPVGDYTKPGSVEYQLDAGLRVDPHKGVITYSFTDSAVMPGIYNSPKWQAIYGFTQQIGFTPFTEAQREAAREAMQNWDDIIAPSFKEVNGHGAADISLQNTYTGPGQAEAFFPYSWGDPAFKHVESDVWVADPRVNPSNLQLEAGFYGLQTLNHEIGHSLGLLHPGAYDASDNEEINYDSHAEYFQDSHQFSIMSYFDSYETGAQPIDWSLMRLVYPSTPMVHDIYVAQQMYGADMTTRTGDTTYGFNATADVTNEAMRFEDGELLTIFTIWDAGGEDTLDLSGYDTPSIIDLREGAYSSAGGAGEQLTLAQIDANNVAAGLPERTERLYEIYFEGGWSDDGGKTLVNEGLSWKEITGTSDDFVMEQNIGIAYGAVIENALGGGGDDRINGNKSDNRLTGGDGNDILSGGAGADMFIFANDGSVDTILDFETGLDVIDLSLLGITAGDVSINGDDIFAKVGADTLHIIGLGDQVTMTDLLFG